MRWSLCSCGFAAKKPESQSLKFLFSYGGSATISGVTFWTNWPLTYIFIALVYFELIYIKFEDQGHRLIVHNRKMQTCFSITTVVIFWLLYFPISTLISPPVTSYFFLSFPSFLPLFCQSLTCGRVIVCGCQSSVSSVHTQVMNMFNMISIESSSAYSKSGDDKHGFRWAVSSCSCFLWTIFLSDLPSVLWRCWLGGRKGIWPVKKLSGVVPAWLSGARFRLAYSLADSTATHFLLLQ